MTNISGAETPIEKYAGILVHPTSFPSPYGIGDLGDGAYHFIDFLEKSGLNLWQVLPLGHTGFGDSPYQPFSSFAGQPLIISIDFLKRVKLLYDSDFTDMPVWNPVQVDYGTLISFKTGLLHLAYERFIDDSVSDDFTRDPELMNAYQDFCEKTFWLEDYALFMAGKDYHQGAPWYLWEDSLKKPTARQRASWIEKLDKEMGYYKFIQFLFHHDWSLLKNYANGKGIKIVGDIPIFVAWDSVDVWRNPSLFKLDSKGYPTVVAGVPPDYFSATGQLWGNPLYNWDVHRQSGFDWWVKRLAHCFNMYDIVRIDHFRGFDEYYAIPFGDTTAENGWWEKGPGMDLFRTISYRLGDRDIIAEDLGFMTDTVKQLVENSGLPNMKVIEFAFDARDTGNASDYLPHNYPRNCVVYTGTHDNETLRGWFRDISPEERRLVRQYLRNFHDSDEGICEDLITLVMRSVANLCIIPMQDYLGLDNSARINQPSTLGKNWRWRLKKGQFTKKLQKEMLDLATRYGRRNWTKTEEELEAEKLEAEKNKK